MPQVVPPPKSDHPAWELEKATLETPSEDPVRAGSNWLELCGTVSSWPGFLLLEGPACCRNTSGCPSSQWRLLTRRNFSSRAGRAGGSKSLSGRAQSSRHQADFSPFNIEHACSGSLDLLFLLPGAGWSMRLWWGRFFLFPLPISLCRNLDSDEQEI